MRKLEVDWSLGKRRKQKVFLQRVWSCWVLLGLGIVEDSREKPARESVLQTWQGKGRTSCVLPHEAVIYLQELEKTVEKNNNWEMAKLEGIGGARKLLGGPGSSPPRCTSKCGRCTPCKPVHVPVPPGTPVTTEYYPEAWRCKCGNKLYLP
ncbi:Epidermal patterning factor-like protein [Forsythia ovata]|uniref:Epidermal patterning factor-like protein n=1 Tax=Forsythia ovata TaxID=205694 RepID=A0ABD1RKW5_9LAMI